MTTPSDSNEPIDNESQAAPEATRKHSTGRSVFDILRAMKLERLILFVLCLVAALAAYQRNSSFVTATYLAFVSRNILSDVFIPNNTEFLRAIEKGMRNYDPYFELLESEEEFLTEYKKLTETATVRYGIFFDNKTGAVTSVIKHSPNAGRLKPGDILKKVNAETDPTKFLAAFQAGKTAEIELLRENKTENISVSSFEMKPAYVERRDNDLYITMYFFKEEATTILKEALIQEGDNLKTLRSVTFDLSQCPGGKVDSLAVTLNLFLPKGTTLFYEKRKSQSLSYIAKHSPIFDLSTFNGMLRLEKSGKTASSAEIFTGVMMDKLPSLRVSGETTYGKWTSIQYLKFLKGGVRLSVGRIFLPDGRSYEGIGI